VTGLYFLNISFEIKLLHSLYDVIYGVLHSLPESIAIDGVSGDILFLGMVTVVTYSYCRLLVALVTWRKFKRGDNGHLDVDMW